MKQQASIKATLAIAVVLSAGLGAGCGGPAIPPPPYPPDQLVSNLTRAEVKGLYDTLRDFRENGERVKEITPNGHVIRARMSMLSCPVGNGHPYDRTWTCTAQLVGVFRLKNKFHRDTGVNGGNVAIEFNAAGDNLLLKEMVTYHWDHVARTLTVNVSYPAMPNQNFTRNWGTYKMKGVSSNKIRTESSNASGGFSFSSGPALLFEASVEKTEAAKSSFLRVILDKNPYWANQGIVEFRRNGFGETTFALGMDWFTDALVDYAETVTQHSAECNGSYKHSGSFGLKYLNPNVAGASVSGAIKGATGSEVACRAWADAVAARLQFRATNASTCSSVGACAGEPVGERFRTYVRITNLHNGNCRRQYDAAFTAAVDWLLRLQTVGGVVVTGFDLGSSSTVWGTLSSPSFETTYPCT
jgi:hypothetical protein